MSFLSGNEDPVVLPPALKKRLDATQAAFKKSATLAERMGHAEMARAKFLDERSEQCGFHNDVHGKQVRSAKAAFAENITILDEVSPAPVKLPGRLQKRLDNLRSQKIEAPKPSSSDNVSWVQQRIRAIEEKVSENKTALLLGTAAAAGAVAASAMAMMKH